MLNILTNSYYKYKLYVGIISKSYFNVKSMVREARTLARNLKTKKKNTNPSEHVHRSQNINCVLQRAGSHKTGDLVETISVI